MLMCHKEAVAHCDGMPFIPRFVLSLGSSFPSFPSYPPEPKEIDGWTNSACLKASMDRVKPRAAEKTPPRVTTRRFCDCNHTHDRDNENDDATGQSGGRRPGGKRGASVLTAWPGLGTGSPNLRG